MEFINTLRFKQKRHCVLYYYRDLQNFFFSSKRRHTSWNGDWSSDVCSSDLLLQRQAAEGTGPCIHDGKPGTAWAIFGKRSEERRVGKSVDLGGRRIIKKK